MRSRLTVLTIAVLMALTAACTAQVGKAGARKGHGAARAGNAAQGQQCAKQLGLSQDQMAKIKDIAQKFRADARDILKSDAAKEDKQAKVKGLKTQAAQDINAILTPDQQAKAAQNGFIDRILSPRERGGHELLIILKQLNLTDDQKASVKPILSDAKTQGEAIRNDSSLTKEQKMAKFQELRKTIVEKIEAVLDANQLAKFRELLAKQPQPGTARQPGAARRSRVR
jgi:Spy/CpxP family protein refolding chaperone